MDASVAVRHCLASAGFNPPQPEIAELEQEYLIVRQMVQLLYTVEAARYEHPCVGFDPAPNFVDWSETGFA